MSPGGRPTFGDGETVSCEEGFENMKTSVRRFIDHYMHPSFIELDLPLTNIRIHIESPLSINRDPLPRLLNLLPRQLRIHNLLPLSRLAHDARIRIHHHTMSPSVITRLHIPRRTAQPHIDLIVHRSRSRLQLPVQRSRRQVEGAGVQEQETTLAGGDGGEFGEADVVADGEGDLAVGRYVDQSHLVSGGQDVGFFEFDFARYVYVE